MIIWLTGQPGAGKTTLAELLREHVAGFRIDGDDLRAVQPEGYDVRGRFTNVSRAQDIALFLHNLGHYVLVSLVSPNRAQREWLKAKAAVLEVYVHTTEVRGREHFFSEYYEPPRTDYIDLDTGELSEDDCVRRIMEAVGARLAAQGDVHRKVAATPSGA